MVNTKEKQIVKQLVDEYFKQYSKYPTFVDLIKDCIRLKGISTANYLFDSLKMGWLSNGFRNENFKEIHQNIFSEGRDYYYSELENYLNEENQANLDAHYKQSKQ